MWTLATLGCHSLYMFATSELWRRASLAFKPMQAESFKSKKPTSGSNAASKNGSYQGIASAMLLRVQNYLALAAGIPQNNPLRLKPRKPQLERHT